MNKFQNRISYNGDLQPILQKVCEDYKIGDYLSYSIIEIGYEDFNLILQTSEDKYFIKFFADFRSDTDCQRYINIAERVLAAGVNHPKLLSSDQGHLYNFKYEEYNFRLAVEEYLDGADLYAGKLTLDKNEKAELVRQVALINQIDLKPEFIYDSWAIPNISEEYTKKKSYLGSEDNELVKPVVDAFLSLELEKLPYCFTHGDIINTNIFKTKDGKLYIIDFSVANYCPRIQELAVLLCNSLFDETNKNNLVVDYKFALNEYQKYIQLTDLELKTLPTYLKAAHAMHLICGTYEKKAENNLSAENEYWINLGRTGLKFMTDPSVVL